MILLGKDISQNIYLYVKLSAIFQQVAVTMNKLKKRIMRDWMRYIFRFTHLGSHNT